MSCGLALLVGCATPSTPNTAESRKAALLARHQPLSLSSSTAYRDTFVAQAEGVERVATPETDDDRAGFMPQLLLERSKDEIRDCFSRHVALGGPSDVQLEIRAQVWPSGRLSEVEVGPEGLGRSALAACISELASYWRLPAPGREQSLSIPVRLSASTL